MVFFVRSIRGVQELVEQAREAMGLSEGWRPQSEAHSVT